MSKFLKIFFAVLLLTPLISMAQRYNQDDASGDERPRKLGVRLGMGFSTIRSAPLPANERIDSLPAIGFTNTFFDFGYSASAYWRTRLGKQFHLQAEAGGTMKGARFRNDETDYSRITLLYIDVPVYAMFDIAKNNRLVLLLGPQTSFMVNSQMFIDNEPVASFIKLPMKTIELLAVGGIQYNGSLVGIQLTGKVGLTDINGGWQTWDTDRAGGTGVSPDQITPSIRNVGRISNFSIELAICF